jgi:hypothetical protein
MTKTNPSRRIYLPTILIASILCFLISGCFPGSDMYSVDSRAGFFSGVWHGWIAPVSLIVGFFKSDVRIYEPHNTGWWYDLGFYISIISGFGGFALTRSKKSRSGKSN